MTKLIIVKEGNVIQIDSGERKGYMVVTKEQMEKVMDFIEEPYAEDKIGEKIVSNFLEDDVTSTEIGTSLYHVLKSVVKNERDLQIVNETLIAVNGYSLNSIIEQVKEQDAAGIGWETLGYLTA